MATIYERLKSEFFRLRQQQLESMKAAAFLGMTAADTRAFDARQFALRLLSTQLRSLFTAAH
jgi:hypothetical protein